MKNVNLILKQFLSSNSLLTPAELGGHSKKPISIESIDSLYEALIKEKKVNNLLLYIMTVMFSALFILGFYLVVYYKNRPETIGVICGGTFLSLSSIIYGLQRLWKQKSQMDYLLLLIPNLPSEDIASIVETLIFGRNGMAKLAVSPSTIVHKK